MSFASETKKELVQIESDDCCAKAELSAVIRMNGVISLSNKGLVLDFATENAAGQRRPCPVDEPELSAVCDCILCRLAAGGSDCTR